MFQSVLLREKFVFDIAYKRGGVAGSHLGSRFDSMDLLVVFFIK